MMAEGWWFLIINAVVAAIAVLSSWPRPPLSSPRRGGVTRRASSVVLQRLRSFSIFSFPSACFPFLQPDAAASQETEEPAMASPTKPSPRALALAPPPAPAAENEDEDDEDPNAMSMEEVYALVLEARRRPEREREEEARRSEVDGQEEEFIRRLREDQRQRRLNSIFNYTQMLKQRALAAAGPRQPDARPDQL